MTSSHRPSSPVSNRADDDDDSASLRSLSPPPVDAASPQLKGNVEPFPGLSQTSRAVTPLALGTPCASQPPSPDTDAELGGIERNLMTVSRDSTPTSTPKQPRKPPRTSYGERKSALSKEYVVDSEDEAAPTSPLKRARGASRAQSEQSEEEYSEDELPAYPATDPIKAPPPSTIPLVPMSQVSDLPEIPTKVKSRLPRNRKWNDDDYEVYLRTHLTSTSAVHNFLASKWLSAEDVRRLEATGLVSVKRGKFLESEKKAIREHLTTFQDTHKFTDSALVDLIMSKGHFVERSAWPTFWFDIAAEVPGRPVKSVVEAVKRMYDPRGRKGLWLPSEDSDLRRAQDLHPNEWTKISELVDRTELDCRDRWRDLRDLATRESGRWSREETMALEAAVEKACKNAGRDVNTDAVPWDRVVELMEHKRTATQCRTKWKGSLLNGVYDPPGPFNARRVDRRKMLNRLRDLEYEHENDIVWKDVPSLSWVVRPALLKDVWKELRKRVVVPERQEMGLPDLLDKIEAGLDAIDARVGQSGALRRKRPSEPMSRAKRMKTKAQSMAVQT